MAPSPTGHLHVGTAKATLFNWLFARHYDGTFILRLEDTDAERSKDEFAREIVTGLHWLGLDWDEGPYLAADGTWMSKGEFGPYVQSERTALYRAQLEKLLASGAAYWCYCTKEELESERERQQAAGEPIIYSGTCRDLTPAPEGREPQVIRIRVPAKKVSFDDMVRGTIETDLALLGDMAIARSLDSALYNFAVVVDDASMQITHVVRGEDHISNTPKQLVIFEALGYVPPIYAHFPLNLDSDRKKMSKRTMEVSLMAYRDQGFLPSALLNFFALLGWHPSSDEEVMLPDELIKAFTIERVQKSGAIFDETKLRFINREHIKRLHPETLAKRLRPFLPADPEVAVDVLERYVVAEQGRADTLVELAEAAGWLTSYLSPLPEKLAGKGTLGGAREHLETAAQKLAELQEQKDWLQEFESWIASYAELHGKREVFWPVRVALTGQEQSPDPITVMRVLGPADSLSRLRGAAENLA